MNKPLILVVEDDPPVRNLITTTLKAHGYRYITAHNGNDALLEASTHNPDILLLDLGLYDIDGMEVIGKVRGWSEMPITVISARSEDKDKIEAAITDRTRAILVTNPGNPTGVVLDQKEMRMIADIAKKHNLFLICDEVYREFCYDDKFGVPTMARFRDIDENLVIIDSVSKRFSACGARVGCVITRNKDLQQAILKFCQSRLSVATIDQIGAAALYNVDHSFFQISKYHSACSHRPNWQAMSNFSR